MMGPWTVVATDEFEEWMMSLTEKQRDAIKKSVRLLHQQGPVLGRPHVDTIQNSRYKNMKELRISSGGALRVLFAFDPRRTAVLLLGGDKSKGSKWNDWYPGAIQQADKLFSQHLQTQGDQGHDN